MPPCEQLDNLLKGRASAAYERAMSDLECTSDDMWHTLLRDVLVRYVKLLTNPGGPAQSAPTLTRKEIIEHDTARKAARAAAFTAAAAAAVALLMAADRRQRRRIRAW